MDGWGVNDDKVYTYTEKCWKNDTFDFFSLRVEVQILAGGVLF